MLGDFEAEFVLGGQGVSLTIFGSTFLEAIGRGG